MSQRWFRFYNDAVNDPKVQRLSGELFKAWVNVLCLASKNGGKLPTLTDLAFILRVPEDRALAHIEALSAEGLLDQIEGEYEPHNWNGRQYQSDHVDATNAERQRRHRERKRNGVTPVTVTALDTEQNRTDSETESERASAPPNIVSIKGKYVFEGQIIKLTQEQYDRWAKAYPHIPDLTACLHTADSYYTENPPRDGKWFFPVSRWLERANAEAKSSGRRAGYGVDWM